MVTAQKIMPLLLDVWPRLRAQDGFSVAGAPAELLTRPGGIPREINYFFSVRVFATTPTARRMWYPGGIVLNVDKSREQANANDEKAYQGFYCIP